MKHEIDQERYDLLFQLTRQGETTDSWKILDDVSYIEKCVYNYGGTLAEALIDRMNNQ